MATLQDLKDALPEFARDVRLNLGSVLGLEGSPGLTEAQLAVVALASAYATGQPQVIEAVDGHTDAALTDASRQAARSAATLMAMNNVYYRFTHTVGDPEYQNMPARLRMNALGAPGIPKVDFELACLAVSAINGCSACTQAHARTVLTAGSSREAVQSAVRIAAVIRAAAQAMVIAGTLPTAEETPEPAGAAA
jgi:alkyl hydroperoxide reductase subunit D